MPAGLGHQRLIESRRTRIAVSALHLAHKAHRDVILGHWIHIDPKMGADGVVGVASHLCSREYVAMVKAYRKGDAAEAASIHRSLLPLIDALFATTSPIPVKWAMKQLGFSVGECRLPLDSMPADLARNLQPLLSAYREPALSS